MHRSLAIRLTAIIVILAATAATLAAQGRGFRGGGGVSVFRGAPAVRSVPGPAFFSRPGRPIVASPVAPFVSSPVAPFVSSPVAPPLRGGPFFFGGLSHTFGRFPRTIVVPSVGGYYSPYIWPGGLRITHIPLLFIPNQHMLRRPRRRLLARAKWISLIK